MLALAPVLEGRIRAVAARTFGMDRQTLRDWAHRFNEHGVAGLSDRKVPGAQAAPVAGVPSGVGGAGAPWP